MRLSALKISNFKSIKEIELSDLPNFMLIAGENGAGKSSVFEAISLAKTMVAPFTSYEIDLWKPRFEKLVRYGENTMDIQLVCDPTTELEKQIMHHKSRKAHVSFSKSTDGSINIKANCDDELIRLFSLGWKTEGIGSFEFIPASRQFPEGEVGFSYYQSSPDEFLQNRITNVTNKFSDAKLRFVNLLLHDKILENEPKLFPAAKNLIEQLLEHEIVIEFNKKTMNPIILLKTPNGLVDLDSLSSGQKEIFYTYIGIHILGLSNSILLLMNRIFTYIHLYKRGYWIICLIFQKKVIRFLLPLILTR